MPSYDLDRMGSKEFEHLVQALLKKVIGAGTITFGDGPDGGREATFRGVAPYPSAAEQWSGDWIFQAKFHDQKQLGHDSARKQLIADIRSELDTITRKYKRSCRNYILATNVRLTSVHASGSHDKIANDVIPDFSKSIPNIHIWGYDDIARFLDGYSDIRTAYLHLVSPGDLIAELMEKRAAKRSFLAETIQLYVSATFNSEQYAQLDQAGEVGDRPMPLKRVYIDLDVKCRNEKDLRLLPSTILRSAARITQLVSKDKVSASQTLVLGDAIRIVLIGGPGQGKSTLGQFVAQIHRAHLLSRAGDQSEEHARYLPTTVRIPFRIILKDYAQALAEGAVVCTIENYIALSFAEKAGRSISSEQVQEIIKNNPVLLILDGLDEVTDKVLRERMLQCISEFISRADEVLNADLQIIATSRPTGYADQFDPTRFLHLELANMDAVRISEYTQKWIKAKNVESGKADTLRSAIKECAGDSQFSTLMTTPLQVTIFILIILGGGLPPRQREELFNEYLEVIYKRERAKSKTIIQTEKRLLFGLHQYFGYLLHLRASGSQDVTSRLKEDEFGTEVLRYLKCMDPYTKDHDLKRRANQLILEAQERLVLLVSPETGYFGFELRSIQEFFAAAFLVDSAKDHKQLFDRFEVIALPAHWRYVALFFAGRVGRTRPGSALQIVEACRDIDRRKPDYYLRRGASLALDIALDRSFGPDRILQRATLEYALSALESELGPEGCDQLSKRIRQLPREDFEHHVVLLLGRRLERAQLPQDLNMVVVALAVGIDFSLLRSIFDVAIEKMRCPFGIYLFSQRTIAHLPSIAQRS